jgi:hypothetical protein
MFKKKITLLCILMAILLLPCFALSPKDIIFGVGAEGLGSVTDTSRAVCAQIDIGANLDAGVFVSDNIGVVFTAAFDFRAFAKQYNRFIDVPKTKKIEAGIGVLWKNEGFALSGSAGLVMTDIGNTWDCGAFLRIVPKFNIFEYEALDYAIGIPVEVVYSGNISSLSIGVMARMEVDL